jgi:hypothetical protein
MKRSFNTLFLASLTALVLVSFSMAPAAEAARAGGGGGARASGGGGGGGGGGARASGGGGGARASGGGNRQIDNSNRDVRTNNVRNTSVNNVNVNKNVNVNANGGCCNNGWDNDHHPVAAAAAVVGTAAIIGSMVRTVPANCVPINYGGMIYQQCGSTWYQPQGSQYMVVNPPY